MSLLIPAEGTSHRDATMPYTKSRALLRPGDLPGRKMHYRSECIEVDV